MSRYAIGVDFGTESGRAVLVDVADGTQLATAVHPYANGVIDERLPLRTGTSPCRPTGRCRTPTTTCGCSRRTIPGGPPRAGVDPADVIGVGIDFTACTMLPATADGTPLAACRAGARTPTPGSSSGSTMPPSPRPTASTRPRAPRARPGCRPLRRQDLLGVVLPQGPPDPRRGARDLRRRRPPHRGRRLGRLAADRRRDAQRLHRRLQGDLVEARRLSRPRASSRRSTRAWPTSWTRRCRRDLAPSASAPAG